MHLLTLSWEYPPKIVGGIARVVHDLTKAMAVQDMHVTVVTVGDAAHESCLENNRLQICRVAPYAIEHYDFLQWVTHLNLSLLEKAASLAFSGSRFDLIHAHDWITAYSALVLKGLLQAPLVSTIHATEWGRNQGLHNDLQRYISNVEWHLTYESSRVIVNSHYMEHQLRGIFGLPSDKIRVIPNGVDAAAFVCPPTEPSFKTQYAAQHEQIVFALGRLVPEKGFHTLLEAVPKLAASVPNLKVVIAGKGPELEALKAKAESLAILHKVYFTGFIDDAERNRLLSIADAAVFPSLYEPFGIVALEAMAARVPVVVSDTGGLRETVDHGVDGLKFSPGDPEDLADQLQRVLTHRAWAASLARRGYDKAVGTYNWPRLAQQTLGIYSEVLQHTKVSEIPKMQKG